jgi:hypothetical protein
MRRRRQTNTVKGTKKAAHFLDYLFLAHERDQAKAAAQTEGTEPQKRSRWYDESSSFAVMMQTPPPASPPPATHDHDPLTGDCPVPPPPAVTESFEDRATDMEIEPLDIIDYQFNGGKQEENELLQVFAQAWHHEAQAGAAAPPPPESRDDYEYDCQDFAMDMMDEDISPFESGIFRKRALGDDGIMEDGEFAVTAI